MLIHLYTVSLLFIANSFSAFALIYLRLMLLSTNSIDYIMTGSLKSRGNQYIPVGQDSTL